MANSNNTAWSYLYIGWLGIVCIVLLIVNFNLVTLAVMAIPAVASDVRARQMLQFFLPIIMIFLEFWIYDRLLDRADRLDDQ